MKQFESIYIIMKISSFERGSLFYVYFTHFKVPHHLFIDWDDCIAVYYSDYFLIALVEKWLLIKLIFSFGLNWTHGNPGAEFISCILLLCLDVNVHLKLLGHPVWGSVFIGCWDSYFPDWLLLIDILEAYF